MSPSSADSEIRVADVLDAIADARDEDVTELPPIGEFLDPEALVRFVRSTTVSTTVAFEVYDCRVEITRDGEVTAARLDD